MPKCKHCYAKFEPKYFLQKFCLKNDNCIKAFSDFAKLESDKKKKKEVKEKKAKLKNEIMTLTDWLNLAQKTFNTYIRLRDKEKYCISCNKQLKAGNIDAGHFYSRKSHMNITFNEYNVNGQCSRPCNMDLSGDPLNYRVGLINRYGIEIVEELERICKITKKYTIEECQEIIKKYKEKIKILQKCIDI